jgi:HlyD family secretion protein
MGILRTSDELKGAGMTGQQINGTARARRGKWLWLLAVVAGGIGLGSYFNQPAGSTLAYETASVSRGDLAQVVTASGQLNPVVKVEVGSQISGIIEKLYVDFNSQVREGQLIAQLDPATYDAKLIQAQGNLANVKAGLELAQLNADRARALQADKLSAKADYERAMADLHQAEAAVKISEGALKRAQVDLSRCKIYAPVDGIVISRNVNVGQTVAASLSAPTLFLIANDLAKMQIEADVAEADIGLVGVGQDVEFTVDAFASQTFQGKVTQVRNAPKIEVGVVTYVAIIEVNNPELKLKPGMTANVSVIVARRDNALRIPSAALRFRPPKTSDLKKSEPGAAPGEGKGEKKSAGSARKKDKEKRKSERTVYVASAREQAGGAADTVLQPVQVKTGISDGNHTEVIEGLKEGDRVIVAMAKESSTPGRSFNPFGFARGK